MHTEALLLMRQMLAGRVVAGQTVLDVGSYDVNGTLRPLCAELGLVYTGLDVAAGPNVDMVAPDPYHYALDDNSFDNVISTSTMEHVPYIWLWLPELVRVLRPGGLLAITTHMSWELHRYPLDCWRVMPDGMTALFDYTARLGEYVILTPNDRDIGASARKTGLSPALR
jgi:SAM-dependent methyltransferase